MTKVTFPTTAIMNSLESKEGKIVAFDTSLPTDKGDYLEVDIILKIDDELSFFIRNRSVKTTFKTTKK